MDLSRQWPYITQVAQHRLEHNKTERHVAGFGTYIEVIGAAGELAARHFLQLPLELHEHFDHGADIVYKDIRIDVKATVWTRRLQYRNLQWPIGKRIKADVVLFTAVNEEKKSAVVVGYALPEDIQRAPANPERKYECYEIPVRKLRKASQLLFVECRDDLYPSAQTGTGGQQVGYATGA